MFNFLEALESSENLDGVRGEGQAVCATLVVGIGRRTERGRPELGLSQGRHGCSLYHVCTGT